MAGEPSASFQDLYIRYSRDVYRFAFYLTRGHADRAEDITAETFLRIWSSPIPMRMPTVKSYLMTIARNLVIEEFRRRRRQSEMPEQIPIDERLPDRASARQELSAVLARLDELPELERAALLLRAEHELSYDEIAAVLDITATAARVRVHRARTKLRGVPAS